MEIFEMKISRTEIQGSPKGKRETVFEVDCPAAW